MEQTELFPKAQRIVTELSEYASSIVGEIKRLDEAIDKKKGEVRVLGERLAEIRKAIGDAQSFAAALAPAPVAEEPVVDFGPDPETFDEPKKEE